jgi:hypothetical protein
MRSRGVIWLAVAAPILFAAAQGAEAKIVGAYILFELGGPGADGAADGIRSASLMNCKTITMGQIGAEVMVHLDCDQPDNAGTMSYLDQAVMKLAEVNGVRRAHLLATRLE